VSIPELSGDLMFGKIPLTGLMTNKIFERNVETVLEKVPTAVRTTDKKNAKTPLTAARIELMIDGIDVSHLDLPLLSLSLLKTAYPISA